MPVLLALADSQTSPELRELLNQPLTDDVLHAKALAELRIHPAMDKAHDVLLDWVGKARAQLSDFPEGEAKTALYALCDSIIDREI